MDPSEALDRLAEAHRLLVACDYDGTLSPIVADPAQAHPEQGAMKVVQRLADTPGTTVALVSGRARDDLARLTGPPEDVLLVGSHGGERGESTLDPDLATILERIAESLGELSARFEGTQLEPKPAGVAFHYRHVDRGQVDELLDAVASGPGSLPGVTVRHGKEVVELSVIEADKGSVLEELRDETEADTIVYLGDDLTDEDAFGRLGEGDVGIKIGDGDTRARYRLEDPSAVVRFLKSLADRRA